MTLTFKYKTIKRPDGTDVKTPSIPITFFGKNSVNLYTIALIDSGADLSVIPENISQLLGLDIDKEKDFVYGIGGKVESVETKINVNIEKGHESYNLMFPVKVIIGDYDFPILLGRDGFFDEFIISFHQKERKVSLKKIN